MTKPIDKDAPEARDVAEIKRAPLVVKDPLAILDTGRFEAMSRVASAMASAKLVPGHLRGSTADCLLVVNQAVKRGMDPLDLAQHTFVVSGKLGYEGKVVAAWINASSDIEGRLSYEFKGEGAAREVTVIGSLVGDKKPRTIEGAVADWRTKNEAWDKDPDQMLAYRGARQWARRHVPDLLLGVYTPDEVQEMAYGPEHAKDITPARPTRATDQYQERLEAAKQGPSDDEAEDAYTLYDEVGEVVGEYGPAQFADEFTKMFENRDGEARLQIVENNGAEIERLKDSPRAEGCYQPIADLITGGEAAAPAEAAASAGPEARPEAERSAAPDPPANGDPSKWKKKEWDKWAESVTADIADFANEAALRQWYAEDVDPMVKRNADASRNEWTRVNDAFNQRLTEIQEG